MVNGSFCSNTHHFRDISVFLEAGNDVMVIYPLGGAVYTDVAFVVNGSFCSNTHHFRGIAVFLEAGNDVIAISPLGGAMYTF